MTAATALAGAVSLEEGLGYRFADRSLLELALTHRSWCSEHAGSSSNQRLEFLGDAVLGLVVARRLYVRYGNLAEGALAKIRSALVNAATLAEVGCSLGLGEALLLGRGEDASGGRAKPSLVADAVEAVIGAVYLDGGIAAAEGVVERLLGARLDAEARSPGRTDFKTRLQELLAARGLGVPEYAVTASGPAHHARFAAEVRAGGVEATGEGPSKKHAEQQAAAAAYAALCSPGATQENGSQARRNAEAEAAEEASPDVFRRGDGVVSPVSSGEETEQW